MNHFVSPPLDTVAQTVHATVDATKNVAASAIEKGTTAIGSAKGNTSKMHLK